MRTRTQNNRGAALLLCLFMISIVTLLVVSVLDTTTLELAALRNTLEYERALQLANAGIHHAAAMLETDPDWRGTVTDGSYPADDTYSATAVDGANFTVTVTSSGVAGEVVRTITASIEI
jgi:Tfp pilus assembly protein PilX